MSFFPWYLAGLLAAALSKPSAKGLRAAEGIWGGEVSVLLESKKGRAQRR